MKTVDVETLRYFVAVADELHYSRAARRVGVSQPTLTLAIQRLERQVGVALFRRTSRRVELTPAGMRVLRDARQILEQTRTLVRNAQLEPPVAAARLVIGALSWDVLSQLRSILLATFTVAHPDAEVALVPVAFSRQAEVLIDGEVDVLLSFGPADPRVRSDVLYLERRMVVGHRSDLAGGAGALRARDLEDMALLRNPELRGEWMDFWVLGDVRATGDVELVDCDADRPHEVIAHVLAERVLTVMPEHQVRELARHPDLVTVPLVGVPPSEVTICTIPDPSPLVDAFRLHTLETVERLIDLIPHGRLPGPADVALH